MCLHKQLNQSKLMPIGMLCLAVGLMLSMIFHPATALGVNSIHFASGFLLGLSIVLNLAGVWRRSKPSGGA